ncbi:MAG: S8 family serine peptidase [Acidimicrobiales bacterium]
MHARAAAVVAGFGLLTTFASVVPASAHPGDLAAADVSVIVVLDRAEDASSAAHALAAQHGGRVPQVFEHVLGGFQFVGSEQAVAALSRAPGVRAVVPDETFSLIDVASTGFFRIHADQSINDPQGPYRGAGTRVAVIDSGVDTSHPDLAPNLDLAHGYNCIRPGTAPEDDNGHGTHVTGIAAAAFNSDGFGVVGIAPSAQIVPLKAFDASGNGTTAQIVCAMNHLAEVTAAAPMPTALNMSFADVGTDSTCDDGIVTDVLHEALCDLVAVGAGHGVPIVPVAAAGNDSVDAASTIPAAFHDVIAVSALADHDGAAGGLAGCQYVAGEFNFECDDTLASFSNWGASVDVVAPGVEIYSDVPGGGFDYLSGTSMAAPHVTGVVAIVLGANATLDAVAVRMLLQQTGECPDSTEAGDDASCAGQGLWQQTANRSIFDPVGTKPDPDGIAEPLVNTSRAARRAAAGAPPVDTAPTVAITAPAAAATVVGVVAVSGTASDDHGVTQVEVFVDGVRIGTTTPSGGLWSLPWDTRTQTNAAHSLTAVATDTIGQTGTSPGVVVTVANTTTPTILHVGGLTASASGGQRWTATATVDIVDTVGHLIAGATVKFSVASGTASVVAKGAPKPGGGGTLSCVTGTDGRCSVSTKTSAPSIRFTVSVVTKTGYSYDPAANVLNEVVATKG